jgi:hypothetical protein
MKMLGSNGNWRDQNKNHELLNISLAQSFTYKLLKLNPPIGDKSQNPN